MGYVLNGKNEDLPGDWEDEPLLFVLREYHGLVGAKFGCGVGVCGACTVIVDGVAARACQLRAGDLAEDTEILTIEGLASEGVLHPVQKAWLANSVPQCGYCQPGQIMSAVALLNEMAGATSKTPGEIALAMNDNLCRCGTYQRIRNALHQLIEAV